MLLMAATPLWVSGRLPDWQGLDWIRYSFLIATIVIAGVIVILRQYKLRRTAISRAVTVGAMVLVALEASFFPWDTAFKPQSLFSKLRIHPPPLPIPPTP